MMRASLCCLAIATAALAGCTALTNAPNQPAFFTLTFDQLIMIALTLIIALAVAGQAIFSWQQAKFSGQQAKYVKEQARLFAESEARSRERERPRIKITHASYGFDEGHPADGNAQHKDFIGLILANTSLHETTITAVDFEVGVPIDSPIDSSKVPAKSLQFSPVYKYKGTKLSDPLPQRLRHGETMSVLYDEDVLLARLERHGEGQPSAVLPVCHDSLGNKHAADAWTVWGKNSLGGRLDPGPGYITWDEWWAKRKERDKARADKENTA